MLFLMVVFLFLLAGFDFFLVKYLCVTMGDFFNTHSFVVVLLNACWGRGRGSNILNAIWSSN